MSVSLSVVIPALDEAHHLADLLPQIDGQTLRPLEVIVADAGSRDETRGVAEHQGARVIQGGRPAQGRNSGARAARGTWICFIDADTRLPGPTTLSSALRQARDTGVAAVVGDYRPYYRPGDLGISRRWVRAWDRVMLRIVSEGQRTWLKMGFPVGQALFLLTRRDAFLELGGFDARAEPFEDSEYLLRVHRRLEAPPGSASAVGVMPPGFFVRVSTRRYDALGRLWFPISMAVRGAFLRWLLRREMPDPGYWELNEAGRYRERREATPAPQLDGTPQPSAEQ